MRSAKGVRPGNTTTNKSSPPVPKRALLKLRPTTPMISIRMTAPQAALPLKTRPDSRAASRANIVIM